MSKGSEIKKALIETLGANPNLPLTATVVSIEGTTCTVKLVTDLVLSDVRLNATISDDEDLLLLTPKIGSEVIVMSQTGKLSGLMVIKVDSVETIKYKKGGFEFLAQNNKITFKNNSVDFGVLIGSFIDTVKSAMIDTPNGPGSINASTQQQLTQLKNQFKLILNNV